MEHRLLRFFQALRAQGLPVSPAETIDAMRAVAVCGIDRPTLRAALATCLVKDVGDLPDFHRLFDRFFPLSGVARGREKRAGASGDGWKSRRLSADGTYPTRPMPGEPRKHEVGLTDERRRVLSPDAHHHDPQTRGAEREGRLSVSQRALLYRPFSAYRVEELRDLEPELQRLCRFLARRLSRRFTAARHGQMDFPRTFRQSVATGGIPCHLAWRRRRLRHTDLLALCDLSHSVATASYFFLSLLATTPSVFRRCQFFGFVDQPVEITFEAGHVFPAGRLDLSARSDYGSVLQTLAQWTGLFSRSTLVVILGDARTNRRPPRQDLLGQIRQRCRAVVWINPEPENRWDTGDSVIARYAPHCNSVLHASNGAELRSALEHVIHQHA